MPGAGPNALPPDTGAALEITCVSFHLYGPLLVSRRGSGSDLKEARHHHSGVRDEWGPGAVLVQEAPWRRIRQPCNHGQTMEAGAKCESHITYSPEHMPLER
jgi:hypothetical protein